MRKQTALQRARGLQAYKLYVCFCSCVVIASIAYYRIASFELSFTPLNVTNRTEVNQSVFTELHRTNSTAGNSPESIPVKKCFRLSWSLSKDLSSMKNSCLTYGDNSTSHVMKRPRFIKVGTHVGRMGNNMFQIASLLGLAYKYDVIPIIPSSFPLKNYFVLPNQMDLALDNIVHCDCGGIGVYYNCSREFETFQNVTNRGYFQSWKYFSNARHIIKQAFTLKKNYIKSAKTFYDKTFVKGHVHVCVHIRRGDLKLKKHMDKGLVMANASFIIKAKQYYTGKFSNVSFIYLGDEKAWINTNFPKSTMSSFTDPGTDMALMMLCDHAIVTSGTFGWWGAWLAGGTTVYFKGYPKPGSSSGKLFNRDDYYPPDWIGIE